MRRTQLYIKVNDTWKEIDLFDDIVVPITMKVTDIRQFGSKTSSYSLDFDIPHTNNNAQVFGLNSEIDVYESTFEVEKDYPAYVTDGSLTTFTGQFRLKKVIKKNSGAYIYYVGYMYGGSKNFVDALGIDKLIGNDDPSRDLNFSEYAVTADEMTLRDFRDYLQSHNTDGTGWGLTLIDKTNKAAQAFSGGSQTWYTEECTPYLYAREIFDKLFYGTGYTYVSEFLQGTDFSSYLQDPRWANGIGKYDVNSLIYPYMKHNSNLYVISPAYASIEQIADDATTNLTTFSMPSGWDFDRWVGTNWDNTNRIATVNFSSNYYSLTQNGATSTLAAFRFVAPARGYYTVDLDLLFNVKFKVYVPDLGRYIQGREDAHTDNSQTYTVGIRLMKNGRYTLASNLISENYSIEFTPYGYADGFCRLWEESKPLNLGTTQVELSAGDTLELITEFDFSMYKYVWDADEGTYVIQRGISYQNGSTQSRVEIKDMSFYTIANPNEQPVIFSAKQQNGFYEENAFDPTAILNPKTTKLEFFSNFVKMFNLYVEDVSGKTNYKTGGIYPPNTLRIEPYEMFYNPELGSGQSNVKDWTDKIDFSTVEYRRCDDYLFNIQSFTKKQDKDFYNDNYDSTYVTPYGNREVKGVYCTSDSRNEIGLNVSANLCGIVNNSTDVLQCPKVFALDKSGNLDTKKEYSDGIFFIWRNYMSANADLPTNYTLKLQSRIHSGSYYNMTDYYCADTLNKGYGLDDANLNWGETETYYQNMKGTIPTYNDLYNAFYTKEYDEKTAPDTRIMKANAYLTPLDIYGLQLSDTIIVNGNAFHILSIEQWKDEKTPCQIELIKTKPNFTHNTKTSKPVPVINPPVLPIALDNTSLMLQLSQLSEELKDTSDRLDDANQQITELEEQLSAIPADEHKIPLNIVLNDNVAGTYKVVSAEVSEEMYNALQSGSWNTSTVSRRTDNATIILNRNRQNPTPAISPAMETYSEPNFYRLIASARDAIASSPRNASTPVEKWDGIPHRKKRTTDDIKAKRGLYSASWQYTYG